MIESLLIALARLLTGAAAYSEGFAFEPNAQRIYYANHSSHLDTILLWSLIPKSQRHQVRPTAAREYWWTSRWKRYLAERIFRAVPVARQRQNRDDDPLQELDMALAAGSSLIFFPEGTRGGGTQIQPFKGGLYHLARKHPDVTLVPVYINNLNRVLPKGELLPVPILCTVHFGPGFKLGVAETKPEFLARAHACLMELIPA